jgi:hypothetical protein
MRYIKAVFLIMVVLAIFMCPYRQAIVDSEPQSNCHSTPKPLEKEVIKPCCDYSGLLIQEIHAPDGNTTAGFLESESIGTVPEDCLNWSEHHLLFRTNARYLSSLSVLRL